MNFKDGSCQYDLQVCLHLTVTGGDMTADDKATSWFKMRTGMYCRIASLLCIIFQYCTWKKIRKCLTTLNVQ